MSFLIRSTPGVCFGLSLWKILDVCSDRDDPRFNDLLRRMNLEP